MASLIGNKPNQVPTNGDLGSMAYQDASLYQTRSELQSNRNRIINGDMRIDQRNAGASVTPASSGYLLIDRWQGQYSQASKLTFQQNKGSITPPAGFTNYLGISTAAAVSVSASDYFSLIQTIEGFNVADLGWGTANAQAVTLSFRVYSSLTGTFGGSIYNSLFNRSYPFTYSVASANTWTTVTVNIAGDTSGTWVTNNGIGLGVCFGLGVGSNFSGTAGAWAGAGLFSATGATSVVGTSGATFYLTGVQLEAGSVATPFEHRQYGQELALCQRYYFRNNYTGSNRIVAMFQAFSSAGVYGKYFDLPVQMRATPTCSASSATHFSASQANSALSAFTNITFGDSTQNFVASGGLTTAGSLSAGNASNVVSTSSSGWIDASAEL